MGRSFEIAVRGVTAATGAAYAQILATNGAIRIREVGFFAASAVAGSLGIGRAANVPVATTVAAGLATDLRDNAASLAQIATAWTTAPTAPTAFYRRITLPAVIGAGVIWSWPADRPLIVTPATGAGQGLVLWNFGAAAGPAPDIYIAGEE